MDLTANPSSVPSQGRLPLAVTTNGVVPPEVVRRARQAAKRWGLPYVERRRKAPLWPLLEKVAEAFLVFSKVDVVLWDGAGSLGFQPGIAHLRVKRLDAGVMDEDTFLRVTELKPGEAVLDCTLGLAQDGLVAARAVGPEGRVVGLEKSLALYAVMSEGLDAYDFGPRSSRIDVRHEDAAAFLARQPTGSFDVVVFDPMFERPAKAQPSFEVLRRFADHTPLTEEMLAEARRVARRLVAVKASKHSGDFARLGLTPVPLSRYASVAWARVPALGG